MQEACSAREFGYPESSHLIKAPSLSLSKDGGAIRGAGKKSPANSLTGTGSMTAPIATSPSRSYFGPQLSSSYASWSGSAPLAIGWNVSAVELPPGGCAESLRWHRNLGFGENPSPSLTVTAPRRGWLPPRWLGFAASGAKHTPNGYRACASSHAGAKTSLDQKVGCGRTSLAPYMEIALSRFGAGKTRHRQKVLLCGAIDVAH